MKLSLVHLFSLIVAVPLSACSGEGETMNIREPPKGNHPRSVAGGSSGVFIDGKPAARLGDAIDCGGTILSASPDVVIG
ncbi:PAAR domain-containing protein [Vibrio brasiliensis]|uniref:PAAR domain-containing protein n=1 Tax=Vibrio brasiliensis TaxID=170652 RepID=UPI001EFCA075|nr:PAAR domain-containing protein [Vibrio brasiliensis]MCG9785518.1 PAAR domain-containing protein [Vibrio brasiliensis]